MEDHKRNIRLPKGSEAAPLRPKDTPPAPSGAQPDIPLEHLYAALEARATPQAPLTQAQDFEFFGQPQRETPDAAGFSAPVVQRSVAPAPAQRPPHPVPPRGAGAASSSVAPQMLEVELPLPSDVQTDTPVDAAGAFVSPDAFFAGLPHEPPHRKAAKQAHGTHRRAAKPPDTQPRNGTPLPESPVPKQKKHRMRNRLLGLCAAFLLCVGGALWLYCTIAMQNDFLWLDLTQLPYRDATVLYAPNPAATGEWVEYARLEATQQKIWVPLAEIPLDLQHAFVAVEDKNFYQHNGISWARTVFAAMNEVKYKLTGTYFGGENGIKQGASTITQQLVKNLTDDDNATGIHGYLRKVRELYRAYKLDKSYSKDQIMEAYLNVISFTGNTAGVQAESQKLFGVPVGSLTLQQCASIAAITKNPYRYDPVRNPDTHLSRRNYILYEMCEQKYITKQQYDTASAQPIGLVPGVVEVVKTPTTSYFTDKVIEDVSDALGEAYSLSRAETTHLLYNGGLRIYTTVDTTLQGVMEQQMATGNLFPQSGLGVATTKPVYDTAGKKVLDDAGNAVRENVTEYPQAAMVTLGYDGALKAVVGGLGGKEISRGFNRGTDAKRQVGSTMKPIGAYALGIEENRITWSTPFTDAPVRKIKDDATGELREWPANFDKTYSEKEILVADALARSINTIAVRVGERAGIGNIYRFERNQLGITSFIPKDKAAGPMVLGSSTYGVTPYELAGAYMMFGSGGAFTTPHCYTSVQTAAGRVLCAPKIETKQVLSPDTAYVMNRMLRGVMDGYGTAYGYSVRGKMDSVGKTGTTSDNRDYWFVGLTPYYVTATWYGYDSGFALNTSLGTHAPTGAWKRVMERAQQSLPALDFPVDATVVRRAYCAESGGLAGAGCPKTAEGFYRAGNVPAPCRLHAA